MPPQGLDVPALAYTVNNDNDNSITQEPPSKRPKVSTACEICRDKKIKCDGSRPVCGPCRRRAGTLTRCSWSERKRRSFTGSVRMKSHMVELRDDAADGEPRQDTEVVSRNEARRMAPLADHGYPSTSPRGGDSRSSRDQMDCNMDDRSTTPLHLQASTCPYPYPFPSDTIQAPSIVITNSPSKPRPSLHNVLPSRQRADELFALYWRLNGTLYRFLDRCEINSLYHRVWEGEDLGSSGTVFMCLLNVIFSIGCIFDRSIAAVERVKVADGFYQRACALMNSQLIEQRSVLTVQCFLLSAFYLQSTNDPHQCWNFVGLATRIAQNLRLDLPAASAHVRTDHRRDVLRRVWHACVFMDRASSLTFGRSTVISPQAASAVPRPVAHPESSTCFYCTTSDCLADTQDTSPHFFIEVLKLYEILDETSHISYDPTSSKEPNEDAGYREYFGPQGAKAAGSLLKIHHKFNSWAQELPTHLRQDSHLVTSVTHSRENLILWLRYRHIRISVFLPVLFAFSSKHQDDKISPEDALPVNLAFQCALSCVRTALETVAHLNSFTLDVRLEDLDEILPAWGFSINYIHVAAIALITGRLQKSIVAAMTENAIEDAWHAIMKMLKRFQVFGEGVGRCAYRISSLIDQIWQLCPDDLLFRLRGRHPSNGSANEQQAQESWQQQSMAIHPLATTISIPDPGETLMQNYPTNMRGAAAVDLGVMTNPTQNWSRPDAFTDLRGLSPFTGESPVSMSLFDMLDPQTSLGDMSWLLSRPP